MIGLHLHTMFISIAVFKKNHRAFVFKLPLHTEGISKKRLIFLFIFADSTQFWKIERFMGMKQKSSTASTNYFFFITSYFFLNFFWN